MVCSNKVGKSKINVCASDILKKYAHSHQFAQSDIFRSSGVTELISSGCTDQTTCRISDTEIVEVHWSGKDWL